MMLSRLKTISLLVVPIIIVLLTLKLHLNTGPFKFRAVDPEYVYLLSGVTIGSGKLNVGHTDHPGTPIQVIIALTSRVQHLFSGDGDYAMDVLKNPESYLKTVFYVNLTIIFSILFFCGFIIWKTTNNIFAAILIQLSPFLYKSLMVDFVRILHDCLMVIPVTLFITILVKYIYSKTEEISLKTILSMSCIVGLGLAFKLTFISFIIIPIILLPTWKNKLVFLSSTIIAFFIIAFPLLNNVNGFIKWVKGLIIHSGRYGLGEKNVVDWSVFFESFNKLIKFYPFQYILLGISVLTLLYLLLKKQKIFSNRKSKLLFAILISVIIHTILVSKHFALYYMYAALYFSPLIILLNFDLIFPNQNLNKKVLGVFVLLAGSFFIHKHYSRLNEMVIWRKEGYLTKKAESEQIFSIVNDSPFVIIPNSYNFLFEQRGLIFGGIFSGRNKDFFNEKLMKINPNQYLFDTSKNGLYHWLNIIPTEELKEKYKQFYLFVGKTKLDKQENFLNSLESNYQLEEIANFEKSGDKMFLVKILSQN